MTTDFNICEYGENQKKYISKIKDFYLNTLGNYSPKVFIKTYGCQQNVSDSEKYKGMFEEMGFMFTDNYETADVILFNTCAIRENAENKVFGNIGRLKSIKKSNPHKIIVLCGCMTEQNTIIQKIKEVYPFIDIVFGTQFIHKFPEILYNRLQSTTKKPLCFDEHKDRIFENFPVRRNNSIKAIVSIMSGSNNFCSYCIVPYVRGRERSRKPEAIIAEFKKLLDSGYKEITILGQNVNSYGSDLSDDVNFCSLLRQLDAFEGEYVIRFMTSHPKDASQELFDTIANSTHISKHIHLPVQCGNDRILKEMNRKYTRADYLKIIKYAKEKIPGVSFSTDIIVGFPGETYKEFLDTVSLIKQVEFSSLFTFIYSPRNGTPAAKLPDMISKEEKTSWLLELLKVQEEITEKLYRNMVGKTERVLVETFEENYLICRNDNNIIVKVPSEKDISDEFTDIEITDSIKGTLFGKLI